jgi:hypothetical protein
MDVAAEEGPEGAGRVEFPSFLVSVSIPIRANSRSLNPAQKRQIVVFFSFLLRGGGCPAAFEKKKWF